MRAGQIAATKEDIYQPDLVVDGKLRMLWEILPSQISHRRCSFVAAPCLRARNLRDKRTLFSVTCVCDDSVNLLRPELSGRLH